MTGLLLRRHHVRFKPRAGAYRGELIGVADGSVRFEQLVEFIRVSCRV